MCARADGSEHSRELPGIVAAATKGQSQGRAAYPQSAAPGDTSAHVS